jgi:hypothetical protein
MYWDRRADGAAWGNFSFQCSWQYSSEDSSFSCTGSDSTTDVESFRPDTDDTVHGIQELEKFISIRLGGVVVSVFATGPKGRGFKPGQGDGIFKAIKIRSTPFFEWEVKPEAPCHKILRHVRNPLMYLRYWIRKIYTPSSVPLPCPWYLCW